MKTIKKSRRWTTAWERERKRAEEAKERARAMRIRHSIKPLLDHLLGPNESCRRECVEVVRTQLIPANVRCVCDALIDTLPNALNPHNSRAWACLVDIGRLAIEPILARVERCRTFPLAARLVELLGAIGLAMLPTERVRLTTELLILSRRARDLGVEMAIGRTLAAFREADTAHRG